MVQIVMSSIRAEATQLNLSKSGAPALYVDKDHAAADDNNDGLSWDRVFKTINGAMAAATPWTDVWVKGGTYAENVIIPYDNIRLRGLIQDGINRTIIQPASGVPVTCNGGYNEIDGLALISHDADCLDVSYPGLEVHDCYFETTNDSGTTKACINLNACTAPVIRGSYFQGNGDPDIIGILCDGGTVDAAILGNYFTGFGNAVNIGYAVALNDAQRCSVLPELVNGAYRPNRFIENYIGVYFYSVPATLLGHTVSHNVFAENFSYDIYDPNTPGISGISLRENFYGYTNWFNDDNRDGRADLIVNAYNNYDFLPLAGVHSWMSAPLSRIGTV